MRKPLTLEVIDSLEDGFYMIIDKDFDNIRICVEIMDKRVFYAGYNKSYPVKALENESEYILAVKDIDLSPYK